jgi:hypothetical protein
MQQREDDINLFLPKLEIDTAKATKRRCRYLSV